MKCLILIFFFIILTQNKNIFDDIIKGLSYNFEQVSDYSYQNFEKSSTKIQNFIKESIHKRKINTENVFNEKYFNSENTVDSEVQTAEQYNPSCYFGKRIFYNTTTLNETVYFYIK
jgi:hypothetical protein